MALRSQFSKCRRIAALCGQQKRLQTSCSPIQMCREPTFLGRDFIDPSEYTSKELQELLWTAIDLKCIMKNRRCAMNLDLLAGKTMALFLARACIKSQMAVPTAATWLGASCNTVIIKDWEHSACVPDVGRFLATQCDMVFSLGDNHEMTCNLANGSCNPVAAVLTGKFAPIKGLADMMTIFEHFGRLRKLTMGFVGPVSPLFNTYLTMLPRLGMDMQFVTNCAPEEGKGKCPSMLEVSLKSCQQNNTGIRECSNTQDAIYKADIIATTIHKMNELRINMKHMKEANVDWVFMHSLPRTDLEVSSELFYDKRCLAFESSSNAVYISMALMLRLLREYEPKIQKPDFDGNKYTVCC